MRQAAKGRPRAAEAVGSYGKTGRFPHLVGAGVLTRPPQRIPPTRRGGYQPPVSNRVPFTVGPASVRPLREKYSRFGSAVGAGPRPARLGYPDVSVGAAPCGRPFPVVFLNPPKIDTALPLYYNKKGPEPQRVRSIFHRRKPGTETKYRGQGPGAGTPGTPALGAYPPSTTGTPASSGSLSIAHSLCCRKEGPQKTPWSGRLAIRAPRWGERSHSAAFCSVRVPKSWPPSLGRRPGRENASEPGTKQRGGGAHGRQA